MLLGQCNTYTLRWSRYLTFTKIGSTVCSYYFLTKSGLLFDEMYKFFRYKGALRLNFSTFSLIVYIEEIFKPVLFGIIWKFGPTYSRRTLPLDPKFSSSGRFCESERKVLWKKFETFFGVERRMDRGRFDEENGALFCKYFKCKLGKLLLLFKLICFM